MTWNTLTGNKAAFPLRLYPPLWFLIFTVSAFALALLLPIPFGLSLLVKPLAVVLASSGGLLALWAVILFKQHQTTAHPYADASRLVTYGPFNHTRNPMYLGLLLVLIAIGLWLQSLSALLLAPLFVFVINHCNILPEERKLLQTFGDEYREYHARTRRWF
jgi:protein-S-isoprenylcysteine O-methyltransferase Ste14